MNITIDKKSWHYRWVTYLTEKFGPSDYRWEDPKSICPYFWRFILTNLWSAFMASIIAGLLFGIGMLLTMPIWAGIANIFLSGDYFPEIFMGLSVWTLIVVIALFTFLWDMRWEAKYAVEDAADKVINSIGFLSIIKQMIKSFKSKVCPIISYKE